MSPNLVPRRDEIEGLKIDANTLLKEIEFSVERYSRYNVTGREDVNPCGSTGVTR